VGRREVLSSAESLQSSRSRDPPTTSTTRNTWIDLQRAARPAVAYGERNAKRQRRELRLLIEELRFRLARLAERERLADERPIGDIVQWFDATVTISQSAKAALLGVGDRTYQRWVSPSEQAGPSGDEERRLRIIAWLVGDLRHVLTAAGVVHWLEHPHPAQRGRTPVAVIQAGDPEDLAALYGLAAAARAGAAA
jgi:PAS domain-containing protein